MLAGCRKSEGETTEWRTHDEEEESAYGNGESTAYSVRTRKRKCPHMEMGKAKMEEEVERRRRLNGELEVIWIKKETGYNYGYFGDNDTFC